MSTDRVTKTNPTGEVRQCERRGYHQPHEFQADFGAYFNAYCPGVEAPATVEEDSDLPAEGASYIVQYRPKKTSVAAGWYDYCKGGGVAAKAVVEEMRRTPTSGDIYDWRAVEVRVTTTVMDW